MSRYAEFLGYIYFYDKNVVKKINIFLARGVYFFTVDTDFLPFF